MNAWFHVGLIPERVSNRNHAQHDVEIVSHTLYQVIKHGVCCLLDIVLPGRVRESTLDLPNQNITALLMVAYEHSHTFISNQLLTDLLKLIRLEEVWNLSWAEDVIDVLQEGLLHNLSVIKQENSGLAVHSSQPVQLLNVCIKNNNYMKWLKNTQKHWLLLAKPLIQKGFYTLHIIFTSKKKQKCKCNVLEEIFFMPQRPVQASTQKKPVIIINDMVIQYFFFFFVQGFQVDHFINFTNPLETWQNLSDSVTLGCHVLLCLLILKWGRHKVLFRQ